MDIQHNLEGLGLAKKEAAVYMAVLQLGQASVQTIARKAGIVRPTAYVILDSLIQKGLTKKGLVGKKTVFIASSPEELDILIRNKETEAKEQREKLQQLLPELRALFALSDERPSIRLFEGKEGLKNLQREFVEASNEPMVGMDAEDMMDELFPRHSEEFHKQIRQIRLQAGISSRNIYTSSKGPRVTKKDDAANLLESRFMPPDVLPISASFAVHGSLLSIVSFRNKIIGVLIEHPDIANSFRAIFESTWKIAEKYNK